MINQFSLSLSCLFGSQREHVQVCGKGGLADAGRLTETAAASALPQCDTCFIYFTHSLHMTRQSFKVGTSRQERGRCLFCCGEVRRQSRELRSYSRLDMWSLKVTCLGMNIWLKVYFAPIKYWTQNNMLTQGVFPDILQYGIQYSWPSLRREGDAVGVLNLEAFCLVKSSAVLCKKIKEQVIFVPHVSKT